MNTSEKVQLTDSKRHIERFLKSETSIYKANVLDTAGRKTTRRTKPIAKHYAFHANTSKLKDWWCFFYLKIILVSILLWQVMLSEKMFKNIYTCASLTLG